MRKLRREDGCVHFSDLKKMALSPAHYRASILTPEEPTSAMRVGTVAHTILLGPRAGAKTIAVFDGTRRGKAWDAFKAEHAGEEIVSASEWDRAEALTEAIRNDPVVRDERLLEGVKCEVPQRWTMCGVECATSGIDLLGAAFIAELKTTMTSSPERFPRLAINLWYHAQCAYYLSAARANNLDTSRGFFIVAVESKAPFVVTCFKLTADLLEDGHKTVVRWLERLRVCEECDHWPGYSLAVVPLEPLPWMSGEDEEEGTAEDGAEFDAAS